jgi:hypothetical protein
MGYSAKVVLRRPARKDVTCQVRLIVILEGRSVPVALKARGLRISALARSLMHDEARRLGIS